MIKEYNFPNLFHNIIGDVIPQHILSRLGQPYFAGRMNLSQQCSNSKSSESEDQLAGSDIFWIKSKRKKLLRRSKFHKTMNCLSNRLQPNKENAPSPIFSPRHCNFLKKKPVGETSVPGRYSEASQAYKNSQNQTEQKKQSSSHEFQEDKKKGRQSKRNFYRIRTSLDRPLLEDEIVEDSGQSSFIQSSHNSSINRMSSFASQISGFSSGASDLIQGKKKKQEKKGTKQAVEKNATKNNLDNNSKSHKSVKEKKQQRKKNVNFAISPQATQTELKRRFPNNNKKITIYSKISKQRSGRSRKNTRKMTKVKGQQDENNSSVHSLWTGKSVVSIKFDDNSSIRSKRSLCSNDSLLNSQFRLKFKGKHATKTVKFIRSQHDSSQKPYKSLKSIEEDEKDLQKRKGALKSKSKKGAGSQKSIHSLTNKTKIKNKPIGPRVSLLKKSDPYLYQESGSSFFRQSVRQSKTLRDFFLRKNNSHKTLKLGVKPIIDNSNVYNELNNFLKFLNEAGPTESETEIKRTFTKPIVIQEQTNYRQKKVDTESFANENLCIDMGLKLVKKMNKLCQKKL